MVIYFLTQFHNSFKIKKNTKHNPIIKKLIISHQQKNEGQLTASLMKHHFVVVVLIVIWNRGLTITSLIMKYNKHLEIQLENDMLWNFCFCFVNSAPHTPSPI